MLKKTLGALLLLLVGGLCWLYAAGSGWLGTEEVDGEMTQTPRSEETKSEFASAQSKTASDLGVDEPKQILFGDFHVHTTFSFDAFLQNLPVAGGAGTRPPSDACDFARHCSALDFWSINDHAENLTPRLWKETVESVRECNALAGDPANPDLVTYLGWEWSHIGDRPENHYGHKNVVFLGTDDDQIPSRPISSRADLIDLPFLARAGVATLGGDRGRDFARFLSEVIDAPFCPANVPVRDLPTDCVEAAPTPEILYAKLDDWDLPSIVIPHGTAWGIYTPAGSDWRKQLPGHDPDRQTLLEIYSGHGSSEQLPRWREVEIASDGTLTCAAPKDGYRPSCWQAGELIRARCLEVGETDEECESRAIDARQNYVDAYQAGWKTLPGHETNAWLDAGQAPDMFQPAFNFRPRGSAQYMLAIRNFDDPENPKRFDFGFIGSSDNHTAHPGTGYKEFGRGEMSDGRGRDPDDTDGGTAGGGLFGSSNDADEPAAKSVPITERGGNPLSLFEIERASAYFVTGGLVAVHSEGRSREQIWDALERKEVYATSGRRTLLWFDLVDEESETPMGSTVELSTAPRFRVRAAGSFEQKPGCPPDAIAALGEERVQHVCAGECYHPGDERRPLERIEIVRIRPQNREDEPLDDLVEDPWRIFPCPRSEAGCTVEFTDEEFPDEARDTVYYARAIEKEAPLIHGSNPLGCTWDAEGRCIEISPCGSNTPRDDDCLSKAEPRAWSSPIYVDYAAATPAPEAPEPKQPSGDRSSESSRDAGGDLVGGTLPSRRASSGRIRRPRQRRNP